MKKSRILRQGNKADSRIKPLDLGEETVVSSGIGMEESPGYGPGAKRGP